MNKTQSMMPIIASAIEPATIITDMLRSRLSGQATARRPASPRHPRPLRLTFVMVERDHLSPETTDLFARVDEAVRESDYIIATIRDMKQQARDQIESLDAADTFRPSVIQYPSDTVDRRLSDRSSENDTSAAKQG